jgi:ABC-type multidrug transport system ATPase subunit
MNEQLAIRARGLSKQFGPLRAVDRLDLDVPRGSIYGFLGPNGSGKSTTIRMLCGLLTPSEGRADVLGLEIPKHAKELKPNIGYMTQKFSSRTGMLILQTSIWPAGVVNHSSRRLRRASTYLANRGVSVRKISRFVRSDSGTAKARRIDLTGTRCSGFS